MRRIVLWFLSTVTVVVLLFGYHTSTSGPTAAATRPTPVGRDAGSPAPAAPASGSRSSDVGGPSAVDRIVRSSSRRRPRTVTGRRADPVGPGPGRDHRDGRQDHRRRRPAVPDGNGKDQQINAYALPILIQETLRRRAPTSTWSAAPPSPARATSSRCRARSTRRGCDRRGDDPRGRAPDAAVRRARDGHADQPRAARPARRRHARRPRPGPRRWPSCATSTGCSAPTGPTP